MTRASKIGSALTTVAATTAVGVWQWNMAIPVLVEVVIPPTPLVSFYSANITSASAFERIAGTASSVQGVTGTLGAAILGFLIGQQFDGTATPFTVGTALCTSAGFLIIVLTEPKRLFAPLTATPEQPPCIPEDLG